MCIGLHGSVAVLLFGEKLLHTFETSDKDATCAKDYILVLEKYYITEFSILYNV